MKPEQSYYHNHVKPLFDSNRHRIVHARHECRVTPGTPDLDIALATRGSGWLELKIIQLPARPNHPKKVPKLTDQQRGFLTSRGEWGALAYVLIGVMSKGVVVEHFLIGYWQLKEFEQWAYQDWYRKAVFHCQGRLTPDLLATIEAESRHDRAALLRSPSMRTTHAHQKEAKQSTSRRTVAPNTRPKAGT